ncbi:MAG: methyltransferase [Gammaproteobacteria bacterium]|nr:methyltransferase [Gammaproteobacteria bacterium]
MNPSVPILIFSQQTADKNIRVWQQDERRWLDFADGLIQSEITLGKPDILPLVLNRAMLAGMLFVGPPKRILLAGTGGGAMARYVADRFPDVIGDAVEISETIVELAKDYFEFPFNNWQLITTDNVDYVQDCQQKYDLIVIDIAVDQKTPTWLIKQSFLQHCRSLLTTRGHIAFNLLVDNADSFMHSLAVLRKVFERRTLCLSLPNYRNIVVMGFKNKPSFLDDDIGSKLAELEMAWGIEFTQFYQQMLKDNPKNSGVF